MSSEKTVRSMAMLAARVGEIERECDKLKVENALLAAELQGPDGFATWKDAAVDERVRRVAAEKREQALAAHVETLRGSLVGYSQLLREKAATFDGYTEADIAQRSNYYREAEDVDNAYRASPRRQAKEK